MKYLVKEGTKSHIAVIILKWVFTAVMAACAVGNISKAPLGAVIYLLAGILMCPLIVQNQKHRIWVIIVAVLLYLLAPRVVSYMTTGNFWF